MAALLQSAAMPRCSASSLSAAASTSSRAIVRACPAPLRRNRPSHQPRGAVVAQMGGFEAAQLGSQLVGTAIAVGGACVLFSGSRALPEDSNESQMPARECPVCSGSGYEPCTCTKWSKDGQGCNGCHKTGMMRCRGCGGGGRATPIYALIKVPSENRTGEQQ